MRNMLSLYTTLSDVGISFDGMTEIEKSSAVWWSFILYLIKEGIYD